MLRQLSQKHIKIMSMLVMGLVFSIALAADDSLRTDTTRKLETDSNLTLTTDTLLLAPKDSLPVLSCKLYYRLTVDLPGKTAESYCAGRYQVRSRAHVFHEGEVFMTDLSTEEGRRFESEITVSGTSLDSLELQWLFRGAIYDSQLDNTYGPVMSERVLLDSTIEGVGFHIQVSPDGTISTDKRVHRR